MAQDRALIKQLRGCRLATAEILYRLPDYPDLLQSYIWQDYDLAPNYPVLVRFLDFWRRELEGPIHSVRLAGRKLIGAADLNAVSEYGLH